MKKSNTISLKDVGIYDINRVGGKNASLGEMINGLSSRGIKVPMGFAVTVDCYKEFINDNNLLEKIEIATSSIEEGNLQSLQIAGEKIRNIILEGNFSESMKTEICSRYSDLSDNAVTESSVAVRSSATAEDLPDASFAGQQETFLNVRGEEELMTSIKKCFASLYTNRAISYRQSRGISQTTVYLSVCVQLMVRSDVGESGVAFSIDTESGFKDAVVINGIFGLGELIVQGAVSPDEFIVYKPKLKEGYDAVIEKTLGSKEKMLMFSNKPGELVAELITPEGMRNSFCLQDDDVLKLAKWVVEIEDYYSEKHGKWTPVDVEWAIDGNSKELYIVQARPETVHSQMKDTDLIQYKINGDDVENKEIMTGIAVGDGIGSGTVKILNVEQVENGIHDFQEGDVLVTDMTDPDWEPLMKMASGIITNKGGRTCHAAIVARELGVPAIVGTVTGTTKVEGFSEVTVSCAEGAVGKVYEGTVSFEVVKTKKEDLPKTDTKMMLNVASPDMAFNFSQLPSAGVGLAREEFIINNYIKAHPLALINHNKIGDSDLTASINKLTAGYEDEETFFVEKLAQGVAKIAASFYPKEVIVRFSDFKSNEYANLLGGKYYEPNEENPMIGWRGASRYYSEEYKPAFKLECDAIKRVRDDMGLDNVIVMIPFCRTPGEFKQVLSVMEQFGLVRGENGLKVYLMAEVPSNIILVHEFSKLVDGFSIGSNDLTQLVLGLDRDSHLVSSLYDERNEAVKFMIERLIKTAHCYGVKVGICGQGPSDFPDFAEFLVEKGIDSISVTPDSVLKTARAVARIEEQNHARSISKVA